MILLIICGILFFLYSILVVYYWYGWKIVPVYKATGGAFIKCSIIIPARNEEDNIASLLTALSGQTYPANLFEVIVVDDHSTDRTAERVRSFPGVRLISLRDEGINSYKKKAIETGIAAAKGELIVTTDADCLPPAGWLETITSLAREKKPVFIAAPVSMDHDSSVLQLFQSMDFMMLQAITGAVVQKKQLTMCNGANISYSKEAFYEVNGFTGIDTIASGDDMLLMYKIWKQHPGEVYYLKSKEAVVSTQPQKTWKAFLNQRIRWASKANKYEDKRFLPVLLLVYFVNLGFLGLVAAGCWNACYLLWLLVLLVAKSLAELPLFLSAARFFNRTALVKWFFFFQPLHILYTIVSGLFGQFGKYEWKGRKVR